MALRLLRLLAGALLVLAASGIHGEVLAQGTPPAASTGPTAETAPSTDRDAGYYYPPPQTREDYRSIATTLADSTRERRIGFVTGMTQEMLNNHFAPQFIMFAKGDEANKLIIVSVQDGAYDTLYRARALFAMLSAIARLTPYFKENAVSAVFNFFDLCKLLGFTQVTWSDGKTLAHQVKIE
ncbi:MAG TPA: molybdopterin-guanine dinucleotide biosynthesis protein A [Alphaproteobacteria bacterium]|nr:molybdopterin-guanine dinucleotide biosynthesis protein A [Alphaproteobacteria bacterium]